MDPARLPHAPYSLVPDSRTACYSPWLKACGLIRVVLVNWDCAPGLLVAALVLSGCALTARMGCNYSLSTPGQDIFPYYPTGITVGGSSPTPDAIKDCMTSKGYPPGTTIWTPTPVKQPVVLDCPAIDPETREELSRCRVPFSRTFSQETREILGDERLHAAPTVRPRTAPVAEDGRPDADPRGPKGK